MKRRVDVVYNLLTMPIGGEKKGKHQNESSGIIKSVIMGILFLFF